MPPRRLNLQFQKATVEYWSHVLRWLEEPHVKEFWDNSLEHREDIFIFMEGRKKRSPYWEGMFDYWIGLVNDEPYCLLMTSEILPSQLDLTEIWKMHLSKTGRTFSIDFMIGNKQYLNCGLGGPTLEAFTQFVQEEVDFSIDTFFIDPAANNPRAKHIYEKGGFTTVATFYRDFGDEKNVKHFLMVKNMPNQPHICRSLMK
jgi:RimJ/RimL family protein N-acetyltransferase